MFLGKGKSNLLTKEQIAQTLLDNSLVRNLKQGLAQTEILIEWDPYKHPHNLDPIGDVKFCKYINSKGETRHRLEYDYMWLLNFVIDIHVYFTLAIFSIDSLINLLV